jgi:hypothetical protein
MTQTLTAKQEKYLVTVPSLSHGVLQKAYRKTASPRQAIKAKCLECTNFDRDSVTHCPVETCPLWSYRAFQKKILE